MRRALCRGRVDGRALGFLRRYLDQEVMESGRGTIRRNEARRKEQSSAPCWRTSTSTRSIVSSADSGVEMVRYADNFALL